MYNLYNIMLIHLYIRVLNINVNLFTFKKIKQKKRDIFKIKTYIKIRFGINKVNTSVMFALFIA